MNMSKKAVSLTLGAENLLWLKGRAVHQDGNLSAVLDDLISDARAGRVGTRSVVRSVVGTIDLAADDPELLHADLAIRDLFARSLSRSESVGAKRAARVVRRRTRRA